MTLKREMCELSSRARAFSVEALIGVKRQRNEETNGQTDVRQTRNGEEIGKPCSKIYKSGTTSTKSPDEDDSIPESKTSGKDDFDIQQRLKLKENLKVELCSRELWRKFHALGTEMIITKAGRRMFPTVKVRLSGLDPAASYIVFLDIVPVDDKRYRYVYHSSQWMVAGSGDPPLPHNLYVHPDSPATGQLWMAQGVVAFDKLKLTNNRKPLVRGQVSLHSMHKYLPRVHILQTTDLDTPPEQQANVDRALTYTFPETTFTTVTAYQNQQITRLKIASNPFAKGFREASRTRDSLDDTRCQRPPQFPSPPLLGPPKFYPADFFALHPDFGLMPPSSSMYLPGRSSIDPYCPSSVNLSSSTLFRPNHNPYGCHPLPPPAPLTMPVKFVVPPRTGGVISDPTRRLCFEDNSVLKHSDDNIKHSRNFCTDNYSRIILDEDKSRRYVAEQLQDVYLSRAYRKHSTDSDDQCTNNFADEQREHSPDSLPKIFNIDGKSKIVPSGELYKRSISKEGLTRQFLEDGTSSKKQSNIQRFLDDPFVTVVQCKQSCDKQKSESTTVHEIESNESKITATSPLDLTKLK